MNILFLSKRAPQSKDLLTRPYGRFYHIPKFLSESGHSIFILLLDYKPSKTQVVKKNEITWISVSIFPSFLYNYIKKAKDIIRQDDIDWVVGFSDIYFGIIAQRLSRADNLKYCVDAYDNYESYIPWLKPLHLLWRNSIKAADLVTVAGPQLEKLYSSYKVRRKPEIIPMCADPEFFPSNKSLSREKLGLPQNKILVGYFGSLHKNRGIELLFNLIKQLKNKEKFIFVISGRSNSVQNFTENTICLGYIEDDLMPDLVNSIDIALVINKHSAFGNYSYPVKLYEALSCNVPVVAGDTNSVKWILKDNPEMIAIAEDTRSYKEKIISLSNFEPSFKNNLTWTDSGNLFEKALLESK